MNSDQRTVTEEKDRIMRVVLGTLCVIVVGSFTSTLFGVTLAGASTIIVGACIGACAAAVVSFRMVNRRNTKGTS